MMQTEEPDATEINWLDSSAGELMRELLEDEDDDDDDETSPTFISHQSSIVNKLISTVYSGPTIRDVESALSTTLRAGGSSCRCRIGTWVSVPEKSLGKMDSKYTLRMKICGNGVADDGYKWRKYGQKSIKNSPNPR
ncbi:WRKY [Musa troglodytarum]|nr:WRKY [Musa troglodytarum]